MSDPRQRDAWRRLLELGPAYTAILLASPSKAVKPDAPYLPEEPVSEPAS